MTWHSTLGGLTSIMALVPILLIIIFRLYNRNCFLVLLPYFFLSGFYNFLIQDFITIPRSIERTIGVIVNLLDAPLMLIFLSFFSTTQKLTKRLYMAAMAFLVFDAIMLLIYGFTIKAVKIVLGPDIAIIAGFSFFFFLRNVRMAVINNKSLGKAIMISAILLSYSIFSLIYVFYYILKTKYIQDTQLVYYIASLLSIILLSGGILIENKRIQKLNELKTTRKELADIYGNKKATMAIDSRF